MDSFDIADTNAAAIIIVAVIYVIGIVVPAIVAKNHGRSFWWWLVAGIFATPFTTVPLMFLLAMFVTRPDLKKHEEKPEVVPRVEPRL